MIFICYLQLTLQKERETYEVVIENGKLLYRQSRVFVSTVEGSKWIFVLSTSRKLYVGEKKKGLFQHSSFLAGGATIASGRLVVLDGILEVCVYRYKIYKLKFRLHLVLWYIDNLMLNLFRLYGPSAVIIGQQRRTSWNFVAS